MAPLELKDLAEALIARGNVATGASVICNFGESVKQRSYDAKC